jgi:Ser-tRNA(Ala) deacylase AlaX
MQNKLAHTSEHAFIGSLQKLMGKTLNVRKVEHRDYDNLVLITGKDIEVDSVIKAEREVNSLISQGRRVIIHSFGSLAEAKSPNLRTLEQMQTELEGIIRLELLRSKVMTWLHV